MKGGWEVGGTTMRAPNGFQLTVWRLQPHDGARGETSNMTHTHVDKMCRNLETEVDIGITSWDQFTTAGFGPLCGASRWCWWLGAVASGKYEGWRSTTQKYDPHVLLPPPLPNPRSPPRSKTPSSIRKHSNTICCIIR